MYFTIVGLLVTKIHCDQSRKDMLALHEKIKKLDLPTNLELELFD